jgi:hypothetical protein
MLLVTYATKYGSTEEVAEAVAIAIREAGVDVETRSMRDVSTLDGYDGVVLGAALYMSRLHSDARRFLSTHSAALSSRPVALFTLGPIQNVEKEWDGAPAVDQGVGEVPLVRPHLHCDLRRQIRPHETRLSLQSASAPTQETGKRRPGLDRNQHVGEGTGRSTSTGHAVIPALPGSNGGWPKSSITHN